MTSLDPSILTLWELPEGAATRLINVSENHTYLVEAPGWRSVLRLHRNGYHTRRAIECELAWSAALVAEDVVKTPAAIPGKDGELIQTARIGDEPRHLVMFEFAEGAQPSEDQDLAASFHRLGALAARTHRHSIAWRAPEPFERLTWDVDAVFGPYATWGDWRDAPNVTADIAEVLEGVEEVVIRRLRAYGQGPERYCLIHADMRLANLLVDGDTTWLIDFDDCGFGWFLYDFAAAISFIEDHPQVPSLKAAWLAGYQEIRALSLDDLAEIDTFIMLRRMALLAWIGTHTEAPEPQALAPDFARISAELGRAYLASHG
ncbi:MAG: phosphotransferase [Pseudomonadota bacterium]